MRFRILTFNWHEGYIYLLSKTGHNFDVVEREKGGYYGWMYQFRPLPDNCRLLSLTEARRKLADNAYDLIICHNYIDLYDVTQYMIPKILLFHTKPSALRDNDGKVISKSKYLNHLKSLLSFDDTEIVFVSENKKILWGLEGNVIQPGIDPSEFLPYSGEVPSVLMVGQFIKERAVKYGYDNLLDELIKGHKTVVLGINPAIADARLSENYDDLKRQYAINRVYFNLLPEEFDDGYNLSMLEAMATGMPVLSIKNSTSPITDGVDGFISNNLYDLKRIVIMLLENRDYAMEIGEKGRSMVLRKFPFQEFVDKWNELFVRVANRKKLQKHTEYVPRVYDCFIFNDEIDLLEMRLNILNETVDYFVIVEAPKTFSGKNKALYFAENRERFKPFLDRIIHVVVDDMPDNDDRWKLEYFQRNAIIRGIQKAHPDDIIIISDADEIPSPGAIKSFKGSPVTLKQRLFYYFLNCQAYEYWNGSVILKRKDLLSPQWARDIRNNLPSIQEGGWHFSYLGGINAIQRKIESFSHDEYDLPYFKNKERLLKKILSGKDIFDRSLDFSFVRVNDSFPEYIRRNISKYKHLILDPDEIEKQQNRVHKKIDLTVNKLLKENIKILEKTDPELAELILTEGTVSDIEIIESKKGFLTVKKQGLMLHSKYNPLEEAKRWVEQNRTLFNNVNTLCVFGFGLGYHVKELCKEFKHEIIVFEPDLSILRAAFSSLNLVSVIKRVKFIYKYDEPVLKKRFRILKYLPSIRLNKRYFEIIEERLSKYHTISSGLKISVAGPIYGGSLPITEYVVDALRNMGHSVQYIDCSPMSGAFRHIEKINMSVHLKRELHRLFIEFASGYVLANIEEFRPNLLIALAQAPITRDAIKKIKDVGLRSAFWFVENRYHMDYWKEFSPLYDYFFVIQKDGFLEDIKKLGGNPYYLPLCASPAHHRPLSLTEEEIKEYGAEISFVGAGYKNRRNFFLSLMDTGLKIWGDEWDMTSPLSACIQRGGERVSPDEIVKIFNASKINLNLHSSSVHDGPVPEGDFVNPRTFEIPACGGFQLVDERKLLPELLKPGEEVVCYRGIDDLRSLINYYLRHPDEREEIAMNGYRRVLRDHTYEKRLGEMLEVILSSPRFDLPAWGSPKDQMEELIKKADGLPELKDFLRRLSDSEQPPDGALTIDKLASGISVGERKLSETEKIILLLDQMRKQYLRTEVV